MGSLFFLAPEGLCVMAFVALIALPLWLLIAKVDELFRKSC